MFRSLKARVAGVFQGFLWLLTGGRPMTRGEFAFKDIVSGNDVFYWTDKFGYRWFAADGPWSVFRVECGKWGSQDYYPHGKCKVCGKFCLYYFAGKCMVADNGDSEQYKSKNQDKEDVNG